jgi:hypothetical protein
LAGAKTGVVGASTTSRASSPIAPRWWHDLARRPAERGTGRDEEGRRRCSRRCRGIPPIENLKTYAQMGIDLFCFSGGKGLRGPQCSGILLGKKDLIEAALAQCSP